mgnify:FL=1
MLKFRVFKGKNIIQGVSDASFGSIAGTKKNQRAVKFLKYLEHKVSNRDFVWAEQVFGAKVHICKIEDSGTTINGADGLISNIRNQVLAVVSADCLPILLYDPKIEVVAALHGSRKSLLKGIIKNAVSKLVSNFNVNPSYILVGIGPHIRKCHYFIDLTKKAIDDLLESGIKRKNIEDSKICTYCSAPEYFSHRKRVDNPGFYKEKRGRFASFIGLNSRR